LGGWGIISALRSYLLAAAAPLQPSTYRFLLAAMMWCVLCPNAAAFAFRDTADGVSCRHFDVAMAQLWPSGQARWIDAAGAVDGGRAFDVQAVDPSAKKPTLRWNVTALVQGWAQGSFQNEGLVLAGVGKAGGAQFHSRESPEIGLRPSLQITYSSGASELLGPAADSDLDCSTYGGTGHGPALNAGPKTWVVLRFDLQRLRKGQAGDVKRAELILVRTGTSVFAVGGLGVFRLETPYSQPMPPLEAGLAANFPGDRGIEKHPEVLFVDRFDAAQIDPRWTPGDREVRMVLEPISPQAASAPLAIEANSLRATIPARKNTGLDLRYDFKVRGQPEPDEVYLRYYLRLGREWRSITDSGKLPGLAGTYGKVGWGGRGWDGQLGWSARGSFIKGPPADHPLFGRVALASYVYHSKAGPSGYGETLTWDGAQGAGFIETERWVCVEQFVKLNTPGAEDGVLKAWVDGRLVFSRSNFRFRDNPQVKIQNAWMDLYYGGADVSPRSYAIHIDNVVIAKRYIGPMAAAPGRP
jgi:hypothetical protein